MSVQLVSAQNPGWWHLTDQDGLPGLTVHDIVQDDDGYMWMATNGGLCRFDGRDFKVYDDLGFQDNEILKLKRDKHNRLWFSNIRGELSYMQNEEVRSFSKEYMQGERITNVWATRDGLLVASKKDLGLFKFAWFRNGENDSFDLIDVTNLNAFRVEINGVLLSSKEGDYFFFDTKKTDFKILHLNKTKINTNHLSSNEDFPVFKDVLPLDIEPVLGSTWERCYNIDSGTIEFIDLLPNSKSYTFHLENEDFISVRNGEVINRKRETNIINFIKALSGFIINSISKDNEGNYWVGTNSQGVFIIPDFESKFFNKSNGSLLNNTVYDIIGSGDQILVGQGSGCLSVFEHEEFLENIHIENTTNLRSIVSNQDAIFLGFGNKILDYKKGQEFIFKKHNYDTTYFRGTKRIILDDKKIFIANSFGVFGGDIDYDSSIDTTICYLRKRSYALSEDLDNTLWIGSVEGIYYVENDSTRKFESEIIPDAHNVTDMVLSKDGSVWASLNNLGVVRIKDKKVLNLYNDKNGLTSNICTRLQADHDTIWIGTNKGIDKLVIGQGIVSNISMNSGLISNEVNAIHTTKENVWIGTPTGLSVISRTKFNLVKPIPTIVLNKLKINGKDHEIESGQKLKYNQNDIEIQYNGFSYTSRGKETYMYRMIGLDSTWHSTQNRSVSYYGMPHGDYTFQVYTISTDNVKSKESAAYNFSISQIWWKRWYVILLGLFLLGVASFFVFKRQQSKLLEEERSKQKVQKRMEQLKMQALQSQMNPHFIFNTLNGIQDFLLSSNKDSALNSLTNFSRMMSFVFDNSDKKVITLNEEIEFLNHYLALEKLRFEDKIKIDFEVKNSLLSRKNDIYIPPLLLQPIIENAFQHGLHHKLTKSNLKITFEESVKSEIKITVHDDGVGRERANEIQSQSIKKNRSTTGLMIVTERIAIFHKVNNDDVHDYIKFTDLMDEHDEASGTKVEIWL